MNKHDKLILDRLLPNVADNTITKEDEKMYNELLQKEWDRISEDRHNLMKYYPHAIA